MSPYCDQITCVWAGASWAPTIRMDAFQRAACTTARPSTLLSPLSNEKERTDQESEQLTRCMRNSQGGVSTLELWSCRCRCDLLKWYLTRDSPPGWGSSDGQLSQPWLQCLCDHSWLWKQRPGVDLQVSARSDKLNLFSSHSFPSLHFPYIPLK